MSDMARGPLRPGARVGAFVVREEIGRGATSVVYEAEHRSLRHPVAVKVLRSSTEMEGELRLRFEREMRLCSTVSSVHVPHVYDVGELPSGLPYIVMERLIGASLADWLAIHRRLPVAVVIEIGIQLCAARDAMHQHHVVHRDVKPENLVLHRATGDSYVVKLVDFGICRPLLETGPALTRVGTVVGTPEYMSPEQVQGIDVDVRTDVYSTGIVLYELLAGRTPFEGNDLDVISRSILFASPPRLTAVRTEVSAVLEGIVMRAMARDRSHRPPSIGALSRELERFADEHGLRRHPTVWGLWASARVSTPPPPPASSHRERTPTLVTPRLPVKRASTFGTALAGLAILLGAIGSVAYYVYEPIVEGALAGQRSKPRAPEPAPTVAVPQPQPVPESTASLDVRPSIEPAHSELPEGEEPVSVDPRARETPARPRRSSRLRAHHAERERTPARTTIAFAPRAELPEVAPPSVDLPELAPPRVTAADVYAQVDHSDVAKAHEDEPVAPPAVRMGSIGDALGAPHRREERRSPYARAVPNNPFD